MRPCADHWAKMRAAVEARGMSQLVAGSGQEAGERMVREIEAASEGGKPPASDFDPLMAMNWGFASRVMETAGLWLMSDRGAGEDGMPENRDDKGFNHVCPLCVVKRDFDAHNTETGRCGQAECTIVVEKGEKPWDEGWIEGCADAQLEHARTLGLLRTQ